MAIIYAKDNNLDKILKEEEKLVVLNFWAPWCGPCRMLHPQLEMIDETLSDQVQIVKVNVDENPDLASQYGVMGIPHSRIIIDGEVSNPVVGFMPYEQLKEAIEKLL